MTYPTIGLDGLTAGRLVFEHNGRQYIYDSRGYEFARYPQTGKSSEEPKETWLSHVDVGVFFGAYNDGWPNFFAFCYADCFDPPQYLICARTFEEAYDIFLDEFAPVPDDEDVYERIREDAIELLKARVGVGSEPPEETFAALPYESQLELEKEAWEHITDDGVLTFAPNGARVGATGKYNNLRYSEGVNGHELKLIRAERFET